MTDLKPCPWCGKEPVCWMSTVTPRLYRCSCTFDDCPASPGTNGRTAAEARSAWNRRKGEQT